MLTAENKNELNGLLKTHEMTQVIIDPETADSAMLATVVQMARDGKDDMALYMLHNLKPFALKVAEEPEKEEEDESSLDLGDLLRFLRS